MRQDGVAMVEFALILPFLVLLLFGLVDFGRAFSYKNDDVHLANEAARMAAVNACNSCASGQKIEDFVKAEAESSTVTVKTCYVPTAADPAGTTPALGDPLHVTVTDTYSWFKLNVGLLGIHWNFADSTITGNSEMRIESLPDATHPIQYNPGAYDSGTKTCT